MDVTKPYEFIGFGAMDATKPYKFIWFGAQTQGRGYSRGLGTPGTRLLPGARAISETNITSLRK